MSPLTKLCTYIVFTSDLTRVPVVVDVYEKGLVHDTHLGWFGDLVDLSKPSYLLPDPLLSLPLFPLCYF